MFSRNCFYNDLTDEKPAIAISACLMGDAVRYDGQHKSFPLIAEFFQCHAQLTKVCPEMGAGFGAPRPAVALHDSAQGIRALGVDNPQLDVTTALTTFSQQFAQQHQQQFQGVIVKSRSPSCGFGSTPISPATSHVTNIATQSKRLGNGIFAQILQQQWPQCLIIEESQLHNEKCCEDFLFRCYVLLDIQQTAAAALPKLQAHYARQGLSDLSMLSLSALSAFNIPG